MYARRGRASERQDKNRTDMEATTKTKRARKKKLTPEENRVLNASIPSGNKYTEAARRLKGSFIVYDPNFML